MHLTGKRKLYIVYDFQIKHKIFVVKVIYHFNSYYIIFKYNLKAFTAIKTNESKRCQKRKQLIEDQKKSIESSQFVQSKCFICYQQSDVYIVIFEGLTINRLHCLITLKGNVDVCEKFKLKQILNCTSLYLNYTLRHDIWIWILSI